ncbi:hypothetical protein FRC12_011969 [Ceratobasidium sp. 428]|nr:hypothetical protein FRC12_011969 [Ceratobasidium sp. 428]
MNHLLTFHDFVRDGLALEMARLNEVYYVTSDPTGLCNMPMTDEIIAQDKGNGDLAAPGGYEVDATGELFYFARQRIIRSNINMLDEQEHDQVTEVDNTSEEDNAPAPIQKRARLNSGAAKPTQKKHVRGKQGGLEGLMKMPIEIFTEIAYLLEPGDLIALIRSNKFFRELLLRPSSIKMWRQAENNVPGLPACPHDMCEPQYAALLFSKYCTASCGVCSGV